MNEIEKLYENAKVYDFRYDCDVSFTDGQFCRITNCSKGEVKDYCKYKKYFKSAKVINCKHLYPPFTAEKQLELIKWLCQNTYRNYLLIKFNFTNYYWQIECNMSDSDKLDNFAETIASMINNLWQELTEEEKGQIRGILKV